MVTKKANKKNSQEKKLFQQKLFQVSIFDCFNSLGLVWFGSVYTFSYNTNSSVKTKKISVKVYVLTNMVVNNTKSYLELKKSHPHMQCLL